LKKGATFLALYAGTIEKQDGVDRVVGAAATWFTLKIARIYTLHYLEMVPA